MFDLNKTILLIKDGVLDSEATWKSYLAEGNDWKETFIGLTGPMILVSIILSALITWIFSVFSIFGSQNGIGFTLLSLIGAMVSIFIASFIFSYLASFFKGKHNFNKGFAALSLAAIPAYIGGVFSGLPFIGWLISLGLAILSLVFLYKIIPSYLNVPEDKRTFHFIASLILTFVLMLIVNLILGIGAYQSAAMTSIENNHSENISSGLFGGMEKQVNIIEQADNDRFAPPFDGKITEKQMTTLILNLKKQLPIKNLKKKN